MSTDAARRAVARGLASFLIAVAGDHAGANTVSDLGAMSLDSLLDVEVSAASKFSQTVASSASSATVLTAAEIRALGCRTLAEALGTIRGLSVTSDRLYAYLGVRGVAAPGDYNTRVLLLLDGVRINDGLYDQAPLGSEFPVDLDMVERIEFIPGQGSAVHGANALFGVVNVVTRRVAPGASGRVALAAASGSSGSASAMLNIADPAGRGLLVAASTLESAGRSLYFPGYDTPQTNHGISSADGERWRKLMLKLDAGEGLGASFVQAERMRQIPAAIGTVFGDPDSRYGDTTALAAVDWRRALGDAETLTTRAYGGRYRFLGEYRNEGEGVPLNIDRSIANWWGVEANVVTTRWAGHKLVLGGDLQWMPRRDQANLDAGSPETVYLDDRRRGRRASLYVEDQAELTPQLTLTAGARYDRVGGDTVSHRAFSPRAAVVYRPDERTVLKYIYGAAFRPPNAYEVHYTVPGEPSYKANPALANESVRGHELALELRPSGQWRWLVSAYTSRAGDLIVQTPDPADGQLVFRNQGALTTRGLEVEGELLLAGGARLRANWSRQIVSMPAASSFVDTAPRQLANLIATVPLDRGWTFGWRSRFVGQRGAASGYGSSDLTLSTANLGSGWDLSLSVYDLFDREPVDPGSDPSALPTMPQDGRSLRLVAGYRW